MNRSLIKNIIKSLAPPALVSLFHKPGNNFSGNYASYDQALKKSTGYDANLILIKVKSALLRVQGGSAKYERDSVLFQEIQYSFPLLAGLLRAAVENKNCLTVLDFGGSLGSTYFQCRQFLSSLPDLTWCIVEQRNFVETGLQYFQSDDLRFYFSIGECLEKHHPNVVLLSSVLQYLDDPYSWLDTMMDVGANYLIFDRTPFSSIDEDRLCIQTVPPEIYPASYPCWIFSEKKIKNRLREKYKEILTFDGADGSAMVQGLPFSFKGMIWKKMENV